MINLENQVFVLPAIENIVLSFYGECNIRATD